MISVVIPAYEMGGRGVEMLRELLASIRAQTFKGYEVIVSDSGGVGLALGAHFEPSEDIYRLGARFVNGKTGAAANLNNAIESARGDIIKPMFQDDKFIEPDSLQKIADAFNAPLLTNKDCVFVPGGLRDNLCKTCGCTAKGHAVNWVACKSQNGGDPEMRHDLFDPYPHNSVEALRMGENTYGSPSAMAWRKNDLRFDENLMWLFDCEFYGRMAERCGVPAFVDTPIYIRQWEGMATHTLANGHQRIMDGNYVTEKYRDHGGVAK